MDQTSPYNETLHLTIDSPKPPQQCLPELGSTPRIEWRSTDGIRQEHTCGTLTIFATRNSVNVTY